MRGRGLKDIDVRLGAFGGKVAARDAAKIYATVGGRGVESRDTARGQFLVQLAIAEIERVRWQDARRPVIGRRFEAGGVIVLGLRAAFACRFTCQIAEADQGAGPDIVEQAVEMVVEEREPVLEALPPDLGAGGLIHRVAAGRPEGIQIFLPEEAERLCRKENL